MSTLPTYWNYEPAICRKVDVIVGFVEKPTWWCAGMTGQVRQAVEVTQHGHTFYIDNEDGEGMRKVTLGRGGPDFPHKSIPVGAVL